MSLHHRSKYPENSTSSELHLSNHTTTLTYRGLEASEYSKIATADIGISPWHTAPALAEPSRHGIASVDGYRL